MPKNQLIDPAWLTNCREMIVNMSPEERAISLFACEQIENKVKPILRSELLKGTIDKFEFNYNGVNYSVTISRGRETSKEVIGKTIDYDKAVEFAKAHNFEIPMTAPIPAMLDKERLELMDWFQNNAEQFVVKTSTVKKIKSYDRIITKEIK